MDHCVTATYLRIEAQVTADGLPEVIESCWGGYIQQSDQRWALFQKCADSQRAVRCLTGVTTGSTSEARLSFTNASGLLIREEDYLFCTRVRQINGKLLHCPSVG